MTYLFFGGVLQCAGAGSDVCEQQVMAAYPSDLGIGQLPMNGYSNGASETFVTRLCHREQNSTDHQHNFHRGHVPELFEKAKFVPSA